MTEPRRWLDDEGNAPPGVRELLAHAQRTAPIDKRALSVSALLVAKIAATPAAAAALPLFAKLAASLAMVTVASAVAVQIAMPTRSDSGTARTRKAQAPMHAVARNHAVRAATPVFAGAPEPVALPIVVPPVELQAAPPSAESAPIAAATVHAAPSTHAATRRAALSPMQVPVNAAPAPLAVAAVTPVTIDPTPADPLALEVQWLDAARGLLEHDAASALAQAQAHAVRFPNGALTAERELIAVDALHRLGRQAEAEARAHAVLRRNPGSLYRDRLRALLRAPR